MKPKICFIQDQVTCSSAVNASQNNGLIQDYSDETFDPLSDEAISEETFDPDYFYPPDESPLEHLSRQGTLLK